MDTGKITKEERLRLVSSITRMVVIEYQGETGLPIQECLRRFHSSETYRRLSDFKTGYWRMGKIPLLEEFESETTAH